MGASFVGLGRGGSGGSKRCAASTSGLWLRGAKAVGWKDLEQLQGDGDCAHAREVSDMNQILAYEYWGFVGDDVIRC